MKNTLTALIFAFMLGLSGMAMAADNCPNCGMHKGGFVQDLSKIPVSTVKDVQSMPEDSKVALQGNITKHVKKKKYLFNDNTGEIIVEIDGYVWNGQDVAPTDTIMIIGEIDEDNNVNIIEVEQIVKQ